MQQVDDYYQGRVTENWLRRGCQIYGTTRGCYDHLLVILSLTPSLSLSLPSLYLSLFLFRDLFNLPDHISSCNHVRDFFRPHLSDQRDLSTLHKLTTLSGKGIILLSHITLLHYHTFTIIMLHSLPILYYTV